MSTNDLTSMIIGRLLQTAGDADCDDHFAIDKWEWPQGVALYALFKRWQDRGDPDTLRFMTDWFERMIARGLPVRNVNTSAPLLTLACLAHATGNRAWLSFCDDWAEWIMHDMPRTRENGLQHITSHLVNEGELWADTLYMTVLFLAQMGAIRERRDYREEAEYQFLLHIKHLFDGRDGLWFHGWSFVRRDHFGAIRWARGNGWFTAAGPEFISIADPSPATRRMVAETHRAQVEALLRLQDGSGLWHTILDDPSSYLETSASAAIGYGLSSALRLGLLPADLIDRAKQSIAAAAGAVAAQVDEKGVVRGVSHGTAVGMDRDHYLAIPQVPTAYGQGLAFMFLEEVARANV